MAEGRKGLSDIFRKFSEVKTRVYNEIEAEKNIDNVFGFIPADENVESSTLIANIATYLSKQDYNVCVVDNKVFYPNLYKILGCEPQKGEGIITTVSNR